MTERRATSDIKIHPLHVCASSNLGSSPSTGNIYELIPIDRKARSCPVSRSVYKYPHKSILTSGLQSELPSTCLRVYFCVHNYSTRTGAELQWAPGAFTPAVDLICFYLIMISLGCGLAPGAHGGTKCILLIKDFSPPPLVPWFPAPLSSTTRSLSPFSICRSFQL